MKTLGKMIAERRKRLGVSQQDLAEISGVSLRTINAIENGSCNPSLDKLEKVIEPLGYVLSLTERVKND